MLATTRGLSKGGPPERLLVQISLSQGNAGQFDRHMQGVSDRLRYNAFLDSQHTRIWGDGTGGSHVYTAHGKPNNRLVVVPVFGRLFTGQDVAGESTWTI